MTGNRELACEADLLGHVYQELRNPKAKKAHGEIHTPASIARVLAARVLADAEQGQSICDPFAGTGGLLRAAAQQLRAQGTDPRSTHWHAADIDPVVVARLAVNMHLWDLGPHVVIGCADVLAEADWEIGARAEQHAASNSTTHRYSLPASSQPSACPPPQTRQVMPGTGKPGRTSGPVSCCPGDLKRSFGL